MIAVPGQNGVRQGNGRNFCQSLLAQLGASLSEFSALAVGELYTTVNLMPQDAILRYDDVKLELQNGTYRAAIQDHAGSREAVDVGEIVRLNILSVRGSVSSNLDP